MSCNPYCCRTQPCCRTPEALHGGRAAGSSTTKDRSTLPSAAALRPLPQAAHGSVRRSRAAESLNSLTQAMTHLPSCATHLRRLSTARWRQSSLVNMAFHRRLRAASDSSRVSNAAHLLHQAEHVARRVVARLLGLWCRRKTTGFRTLRAFRAAEPADMMCFVMAMLMCFVA